MLKNVKNVAKRCKLFKQLKAKFKKFERVLLSYQINKVTSNNPDKLPFMIVKRLGLISRV